MRKIALFLCIGIIVVGVFQPLTSNARHVEVITVSDTINPAIYEYISESILRAEREKAECLIIQLDTPGGLLTSTQKIVQDILGSRIPVIVFISPRGSWAASAGTFITLASHIAVMAPSTNIGAAHPVSMTPSTQGNEKKKQENDGMPSRMEKKIDDLIKRFDGKKEDKATDSSSNDSSKSKSVSGESEGDGTRTSSSTSESDDKKMPEQDIMSEKIIQNTTSWIRGIAEFRNRNAEWAEKAVTESLSITETEALKENVIDLIADDLDDLLQKVNGRTVKTAAGEITLNTENITVKESEMTFRQRILSTISNPNLFFILALLGPLGLVIELYNPGLILPGVVGGISIILLLYASQVLPVNFAAMLLIFLAIILFIAEVKIQSYGLLTVGGVISMVLGALMLFRTGPDLPGSGFQVSWVTILTVLILLLAFVFLVLERVFRVHANKATTGEQGMLGEIGVAKTPILKSGTVFVHGERWRAMSDTPINEGVEVEVIGISGLTLKVKEHIIR